MRNISLIIMDTMRLDAFNEIERRRGRFGKLGFGSLQNCIAPSPWTLPSHASLFTGMYPKEHGAHETRTVKDLDIDNIMLRKPTLVNDLAGLGYSTYGISANPFVHPIYGFGGFTEFVTESYFTDIIGSVVEVADSTKKRIAKYRGEYGTNAIRLAARILREDPNLFMEAFGGAVVHTPKAALKKFRAKFIEGWPLEKGGRNIVRYVRTVNMRGPSFLFANLMEVHEPYTGKKETDMSGETSFLKRQPSEQLVERWRQLYSKAASMAYSYAADIAEALVNRYGSDQLIIVTSDHGQAFGEHGFIGHGVFLYDEIVRVPMLVFGATMDTAPGRGFSSLVNVRKLVLGYARYGRVNMGALSSRSVRSECFGIQHNMAVVNGIDREKVGRNDRYRKRVFR